MSNLANEGYLFVIQRDVSGLVGCVSVPSSQEETLTKIHGRHVEEM